MGFHLILSSKVVNCKMIEKNLVPWKYKSIYTCRCQPSSNFFKKSLVTFATYLFSILESVKWVGTE